MIQDLIGKTLTVIAAENTDLLGICGEVVDESKQTIRVLTKNGEKTLLKEQVTLEVEGYRIDGKTITHRPEDRTKKKPKQWQRKKPPTTQ